MSKGEKVCLKQEGTKRKSKVNHERTTRKKATGAMTNEQLVLRIRAGEDVAENMLQLWKQSKGLIYKMAKGYGKPAEEEDLAQEGYFGLCAAVDWYDFSKERPFINYAALWIRQSMNRYIKWNGTVRIPEWAQNLSNQYRRMTVRWQQECDRKPTDQEACYYLEISQETLEGIKKCDQVRKINSLDIPIGEEEDGTLYDLIPGTGDIEENVLEQVQKEQLKAVIWSLVDSLPEKQAAAIHGRFQEGLTLRECGERMGVKIEAARQWERKALQTLRRPSNADILRPFLPDWEDERLYNAALHGNGAGRFQRTWTSSTEREAIRRYEKRPQEEGDK